MATTTEVIQPSATKLRAESPALRQHLRAAFLLAMLCSLPSCFTMTVWGFELQGSNDSITSESDSVMVYDPETEWSWELFGLRLLATPFTLGLDCVTAPLQLFLLQNNDDDDDNDDDC
jgi:hypothetical protein